MRLWEKVRNLTVSDSLILPSGATVRGGQHGRSEKSAGDVFNSVGGVESLTAATTLTAADSGKTFFLNLAAGFTVTLPAPQAGLRYRFIVGTAPTTAYIISTGGADIFKGHVLDVGAASVSDDNGDVINFVANTALPGDEVEVISDGTSWFFRGTTRADGGVTVTNS